MPSARLIRVAGIQAVSVNGDVEGNLRRAEPLVARAAREGARLLLCPEFLATGYVYHRSIWNRAEARDGPTERWLRAMANRHGVYIGASYLQAEGSDFFNTFTLVDPQGAVAGRVRKESLPGFEGWYFRSCRGKKTIDTALGRIAVGICQDNQTARFMSRVRSEGADLVLMPHSAPHMLGPVRLVARHLQDLLVDVAGFYATAFGVPVLMVNKATGEDTLSPVPVLPLIRLRMRYPGLSCVCDADGFVLDRLGGEEGIVAAEISLDPERRRRPTAPSGYWARPPRALPRFTGALFRALEASGKAVYASSRGRARAARLVSSHGS